MRLPLHTYWAQTSANVPHAMQRVHSVASCAWPSASFRRVLVATLNVVRAVPVAVYVTSGSCPRWPMSCTRLRSFMVVPPLAPPCQTGKQHCFPQGKNGKAEGEWRQGRTAAQRRGVHWSGAETLAPEGTQAPEGASQSDSALDAHASTSARGTT